MCQSSSQNSGTLSHCHSSLGQDTVKGTGERPGGGGAQVREGPGASTLSGQLAAAWSPEPLGPYRGCLPRAWSFKFIACPSPLSGGRGTGSLKMQSFRLIGGTSPLPGAHRGRLIGTKDARVPQEIPRDSRALSGTGIKDPRAGDEMLLVASPRGDSKGRRALCRGRGRRPIDVFSVVSPPNGCAFEPANVVLSGGLRASSCLRLSPGSWPTSSTWA